MYNLNKAMVEGNLTKDPEMKTLPSGMNITSFSLATNRRRKGADGNFQEEVQFHNITVFGKQAETTNQYLQKGSSALVIGRLETRSWEDKESGKKQYRTEIIAEDVTFGAKPSTDAGTVGNTEVAYPAPAAEDENIPF
jgi:single-strand DNA-binding protein